MHDAQDYDTACRRCEIEVTINSDDEKMALMRVLQYDKKKAGGKGRCLIADVPALGLEIKDRLTEESGLGDVSRLDELNSFPGLKLTFWRMSRETLARHRNPFFREDLCTTPAWVLAADVLHCCHLGVMLFFCKHVVWSLLLSGVFGAYSSIAEQVDVGCLAIRFASAGFYKRRHIASPTENVTRISRLGSKHVGSPEERTLKTKGAQTWGMLLSLLDFLEGRANEVEDGAKLLQAGRALARLVTHWDNAPWAMPTATQQACVDAWVEFLVLTEGYEDMKTPKRHLMTHLVCSARTVGNPKQYANWLNESLNRTLRATCRHTSQQTFALSVMLRMKEILRSKGVKRRLL